VLGLGFFVQKRDVGFIMCSSDELINQFYSNKKKEGFLNRIIVRHRVNDFHIGYTASRYLA
jgi:hypothetical protein